MLGWQILSKGDYLLELPILSNEEKEIVIETQERYKHATREYENREDLIEKIISSAAEEKGIFLDREQQNQISIIAKHHIQGFAFMDLLIGDPEIEEISVIGPMKPVYVYERNKGWKKVNAVFEDEKTIAEIINKMAREIGRHITLQNPRLDAMLADGSRMHASLPPVSKGEITIRKFRSRPFSPLELSKKGTLPADALAFLSLLMQSDSSVIIAGNTASGKTTTLNALFSFVPADERVIITEETPEINIPHRHQMRLVANREMGISLKDLVYDSLRMRPDRMIVGEVRNKEETEALFDVLLAGQARGSYATFHAQSVDEAVARLRSFGIREMDLKTIDCIIIQRRMLSYENKKNREIRRIVEIRDVEGNTDLLKNGRFADADKALEKIGSSLSLGKKEVKEELAKRKKIISRSPQEFDEFFQGFQNKIYGVNE